MTAERKHTPHSESDTRQGNQGQGDPGQGDPGQPQEPVDRTVGPSEADAVANEAARASRENVTPEDLAAAAGVTEETEEALELNEAEGGEAAPAGVGGRPAELEAQVADLKNQLLRALAETENVRNRARREKEEALKYAAAPLAKDLLSVADNLKRALAAVPAEEAERNEALKSFVVGVEMTDKALNEAFAKHGIVPIDPVGEKLDPHRHEAMIEVEDPSKPAGTVAQVYELGWLLGERLLRPARVAVAKGGPKPQPGGQGAGQGNGQGDAPPPGSNVDTKA
jgi:molecular chaperone GrpE